MTMRLAILGLGTMGQAMAERLLQTGEIPPGQIRATVRHEARAVELGGRFPFPVGTDNVEAARDADVILVATKPKGVVPVLAELAAAGALDRGPLLISIAAGVSTSTVEDAADAPVPIVRAMPNTPCLVGDGMIVLSRGRHARPDHLRTAERLLRPLGRVLPLDEEHMDAVTGLSGSGPAFIYLIIEALADGGVMVGLPRKVATELAAQTVLGSARMVLESGRHPAALKDDVTTPAGCTISALLSMEDGRLRSVLARGVEQAARAAAGLGGPKS
jgi:pyrroline-5-carboxylate reductase